jgi:hypothetical protein
MDTFIEQHSGELLILILAAMVLVTLLIIVPQLLKSRRQTRELQHAEIMCSLEKGHPLPPADDRSWAAGRTATLVPIVSVICAGTVTCFLVSFKEHENIFSISLAVWCVAGAISLAAITGGVALMGRLAQLSAGAEEEEMESNPLEKSAR